MNQLVPLSSVTVPVLVAAAADRARMRFLEFFAANIRNPHTRRAYARVEALLEGVGYVDAYCEELGLPFHRRMPIRRGRLNVVAE
jgi:hypothetical protein